VTLAAEYDQVGVVVIGITADLDSWDPEREAELHLGSLLRRQHSGLEPTVQAR
jgi:hypothetical protein